MRDSQLRGIGRFSRLTRGGDIIHQHRAQVAVEVAAIVEDSAVTVVHAKGKVATACKQGTSR